MVRHCCYADTLLYVSCRYIRRRCRYMFATAVDAYICAIYYATLALIYAAIYFYATRFTYADIIFAMPLSLTLPCLPCHDFAASHHILRHAAFISIIDLFRRRHLFSLSPFSLLTLLRRFDDTMMRADADTPCHTTLHTPCCYADCFADKMRRH